MTDSSTLTIQIDGREVTVPKGTTLLKAARSIGIEIPVFCYHDGLSIAANCRMCLVETNKSPKLLPACHATVMPEMEVQTRSERVVDARKGVLQFILLNHPVDCPICDQAGECDLQDNYDDHSMIPSELDIRKDHKAKAEIIGPQVMLDAERCVLCTRCIRFCEEIAGQPQLGIKHRGHHSEITTTKGAPLDHPYSLCTVDLCPVGALTSRDFRFKSRVWFLDHVSTICTGCARGCNVRADHKDGAIERLVPLFNADVNQWWACDAGRLSFRRYEEGRLAEPLLDGQAASEDAALGQAGDLCGEPDTLDMAVSALLPMEDLFLALGFAKQHLGARPVYVSRRAPGFEDDILIRKDKDPNAAGLSLIAEHFGLELKPLDALEPTAGRGLLALCPEEEGSALAAISEAGVSLVLVSSFANAATATAKVSLPASSPFERGGTYLNADKIVQEGRKVLAAPGLARSPWIQLRNLARVAKLADGFPATRADAQDLLFTEIPAISGLDRSSMNESAQRLGLDDPAPDAAATKEAP